MAFSRFMPAELLYVYTNSYYNILLLRMFEVWAVLPVILLCRERVPTALDLFMASVKTLIFLLPSTKAYEAEMSYNQLRVILLHV